MSPDPPPPDTMSPCSPCVSLSTHVGFGPQKLYDHLPTFMLEKLFSVDRAQGLKGIASKRLQQLNMHPYRGNASITARVARTQSSLQHVDHIQFFRHHLQHASTTRCTASTTLSTAITISSTSGTTPNTASTTTSAGSAAPAVQARTTVLKAPHLSNADTTFSH